jgi:putative membrane protein
MKTLLKSLLINCFSLYLVAKLVNAFSFAHGYETLIIAAIVLGLVNLFVRPLINILLLPINLITLGTFHWIVNVFTLFIVTLIVPDFQIIGFEFSGLNIGQLIIPAYSTTGLMALILNTFILSILTSFLYWLTK